MVVEVTVVDLIERLQALPDYAANMRVAIVNENGEVMATDIFETDHARLDFTFANDEDRAVYVQALSRQRPS